jgi:hypothetical protein
MSRFLSFIINLSFRLSFFRQILWSLMIFLCFLVLSVVIFNTGNIMTNPVGWERSFLVSSYKLLAKNLEVTCSGNYIIAVYEASGDRGEAIYASVSFNGGESFLQPVRVAAAEMKMDKNPHAAVSSKGDVTVVWQNYVSAESTNRIFYSRSTDFGATWSAAQQVVIGNEMEILPRVYYDDANWLHLFYHGLKAGSFSLFHALSRDGKTFETFSTVYNLGRDMKGAFFPSIQLYKDNIYMVWQGRGRDYRDDLYFTASSNSGISWGSSKKITKGPGSNASPALILYNDTLYLIYQNNDEKTWALKLLKGTSRGLKWDRDPFRITETKVNCYSPGLVAGDNELIFTWYDDREGTSQIFSKRYSLRDGVLSPLIKISQRRIESIKPYPVYSGNKVVVLWQEKSLIMAKYADVYVAPPVVYSRTHPQDLWTRNAVAEIRWTEPPDESGIAGYATVVNKLADFNPSPDIINNKPNSVRRVLPDLNDGVSYFHIRAIDGAGNASRTIHYRIHVAANPPPMPIVFSPTHKEGEQTESLSPIMKWAVDDPDRLKGFMYSLGGIGESRYREAEQFTTDFEVPLKNLQKGNYIFSISSVDKTDQLSQTATYHLVVGDVPKIAAEELEKVIARMKPIRYRRPQGPGVQEVVRPFEPAVALVFPFDRRKVYGSDSLKAEIKVRNLKDEQVLGFSYYAGKEKIVFPASVNLKERYITVDGLTDGTYHIGVRCLYYRVAKGKKEYLWTRPAYAGISVKLPKEESPLRYYARLLLEKFGRKIYATTLIISIMSLFTVVLGYGTRVAFYSRLAQFKFKVLFRLIFS